MTMKNPRKDGSIFSINIKVSYKMPETDKKKKHKKLHQHFNSKIFYVNAGGS